MASSQLIETFIDVAWGFLGTPYIWSGDDPSGFDCSGFVLECLKSVGELKEHDDVNADGLFKYLSAKYGTTDVAEKGTLLFYQDATGRKYHVVICLDAYVQIGASGGDADNTTVDKAWKDNAYVKVRPFKIDPERHVLVDIFA